MCEYIVVYVCVSGLFVYRKGKKNFSTKLLLIILLLLPTVPSKRLVWRNNANGCSVRLLMAVEAMKWMRHQQRLQWQMDDRFINLFWSDWLFAPRWTLCCRNWCVFNVHTHTQTMVVNTLCPHNIVESDDELLYLCTRPQQNLQMHDNLKLTQNFYSIYSNLCLTFSKFSRFYSLIDDHSTRCMFSFEIFVWFLTIFKFLTVCEFSNFFEMHSIFDHVVTIILSFCKKTLKTLNTMCDYCE